ncbi:hypothetical protein HPB48_013803 [Haemaphysalis longicornis]|uniref:CCHC-type domain-containing protein n=1 Tax=Haemaphysalis longicornis TaxID=44386 RepID=A0A9J6GUH6_HAELO|nr:hypothetical protein HPB48_013803 [Haemaphysalis longicornis]
MSGMNENLTKEKRKQVLRTKSDSTMAKKPQTPGIKAPQPGTSRVIEPGFSNTNETPKEKQKKKLKTKDFHLDPTQRAERQDNGRETDVEWFQGDEREDEEERRERRVLTTAKDVKPKDNWDETSDHEEDSEEDSGETPAAIKVATGASIERTEEIGDNAQPGEKVDEAHILTRISQADKAMMRALLKIASLVGDNAEVQEQLDNVLTAHNKMKSIVMKQNEKVSFQKGRIMELERSKAQRETSVGAFPTEQETVSDKDKQKPTYAMVVSSGNMEKKEVAQLIRKQVSLTKLGIQDATMRPGREGVVITTNSKEAASKIQAELQGSTALHHLQVRKPREPLYTVKVIGIEDEIDLTTLPETIIEQNHLACQPADIRIQKSWKGKQGMTTILALNRKGAEALKDKTHLNIGWDHCPVFDDFFLPRCTKCAEHGHRAITCNGPIRCTNCGLEGHRSEGCENAASCRACKEEGRKNNKEHSMMSWRCPVYLDWLDAEKKKVLARLH